YAAAYVIGQPQLRANVREQSRGEASAKGLIEHLDSVVVGISSIRAQVSHADRTLVNVRLIHQVITGFRGIDRHLWLFHRRTLLPRRERLAQLSLHGCGAKVAGK